METQKLKDFKFPDSQPLATGPSVQVEYNGFYPTYIESKMFQTRWLKDIEDSCQARTFDCETGLCLSFCCKSSFSTPQTIFSLTSKEESSVNPADPQAYKLSCLAVLEPEIEKLRQALKYFKEATDYLSLLFSRHDFAKAEMRLSDISLRKVIKILDVLVQLDKIKSSKPSLEKDFELYRHYLDTSRSGDSNSADNRELHLFLGPVHSILQKFKIEMSKNASAQSYLANALNLCMDNLEENLNGQNQNAFLKPEDKFMMLRLVSVCLYLLDVSDDPKAIFRSKDFNISRAQKLIKQYPIVPLFADTHLNSLDVIKLCPSLGQLPEWSTEMVKGKPSSLYELSGFVEKDRMAHNTCTASLKCLLRKIKLKQAKSQSADTDAELSTEVISEVLQGFSVLSTLTSNVLLQSAFKYAYPYHEEEDQQEAANAATSAVTTEKENNTGTTPEGETAAKTMNVTAGVGGANGPRKQVVKKPKISEDVSVTPEVLPYALAVKYNYDAQDRAILIDYIAMIKGLAALLVSASSVVIPIVRTGIHHQLQEFVQFDLRKIIQKFSKPKTKKKPAHDDVLKLLEISGDNLAPDDPALIGKKDSSPPVITPRTASLSVAQLDSIRSILWGLVYLRGSSGIYSSREIDSKYIKTLEVMYKRTEVWYFLLDFLPTVHQSSDLSSLWLREYFLDVTGSVQFSMELSLPWILTKEILETASSSKGMMEYLLYPISVYNDCANAALNDFALKFLYSEVEAEANLAFDQLILLLRDKIFIHFKTMAASTLLDKNFKEEMKNKFFRGNFVKTQRFFAVSNTKFGVLCEQTHFELIGRTINLRQLITQRINNLIRSNIEEIIRRFESSPLPHVIELEYLLSTLQYTHSLLKKVLPNLDPFSTILLLADESASMSSIHSRIGLQIVLEAVSEIPSAYVYNSVTKRFIHTPGTEVAKPPPRLPNMLLYGGTRITDIYTAIHELTSNYIGIEHVRAIVRLIGLKSLPLLVSEIEKKMQRQVDEILNVYADELSNIIPAKIKWLQTYFPYGPLGFYEIWKKQLEAFNSYTEIWTVYVEGFKQFGNCLAFLKLLDEAVALENTHNLVQSSLFLGVLPKTDGRHVTGIENKLHTPLKFALDEMASNKALRSPESLVTQAIPDVSMWNIKKPQETFHLFFTSLDRLKKGLTPHIPRWTSQASGFASGLTDHAVFPVEKTNEFYRIWSSLLFVFCDNATGHAIYGDGFFWSGSVLVYLLGQRKRLEAMDFSAHLKFLSEYSEIRLSSSSSTTPVKNPMKNFLQSFGQSAQISAEIFALLNNYEDDLKIVPSRDHNPCGVVRVTFQPERGVAEAPAGPAGTVPIASPKLAASAPTSSVATPTASATPSPPSYSEPPTPPPSPALACPPPTTTPTAPPTASMPPSNLPPTLPPPNFPPSQLPTPPPLTDYKSKEPQIPAIPLKPPTTSLPHPAPHPTPHYPSVKPQTSDDSVKPVHASGHASAPIPAPMPVPPPVAPPASSKRRKSNSDSDTHPTPQHLQPHTHHKHSLETIGETSSDPTKKTSESVGRPFNPFAAAAAASGGVLSSSGPSTPHGEDLLGWFDSDDTKSRVSLSSSAPPTVPTSPGITPPPGSSHSHHSHSSHLHSSHSQQSHRPPVTATPTTTPTTHVSPSISSARTPAPHPPSSPTSVTPQGSSHLPPLAIAAPERSSSARSGALKASHNSESSSPVRNTVNMGKKEELSGFPSFSLRDNSASTGARQQPHDAALPPPPLPTQAATTALPLPTQALSSARGPPPLPTQTSASNTPPPPLPNPTYFSPPTAPSNNPLPPPPTTNLSSPHASSSLGASTFVTNLPAPKPAETSSRGLPPPLPTQSSTTPYNVVGPAPTPGFTSTSLSPAPTPQPTSPTGSRPGPKLPATTPKYNTTSFAPTPIPATPPRATTTDFNPRSPGIDMPPTAPVRTRSTMRDPAPTPNQGATKVDFDNIFDMTPKSSSTGTSQQTRK